MRQSGTAQALELVAEPLLAALGADLDQRQDRDEYREEGDDPEPEVGDDLVVRAPVEADAVGGERRRGPREQRREGEQRGGDDQEAPASDHGANSIWRRIGEPASCAL